MSLDILVMDDESDITSLVSDILSDERYQVRVANNSDTALKALAERVPSAIILDIWLQGSEMDGLGILEHVKSRYPHLPVIMISGHADIETAVLAVKKGAFDFVSKPPDLNRLLITLRNALDKSNLIVEKKALQKTFGQA